MSYLRQINWVDIFVITILIRVCYIAKKTGFLSEVFKLLGTISAIYIACHYYLRISIFLDNRIPLEGAGWGNFLDFLAFLVLAFLGYFAFTLIRKSLTALIKMEAIFSLDRWGGLVLGIIRGALFASLLIFSLAVFNNAYLKNSLTDSLIRPRLFKLTPTVYEALWNNLMFRFMDDQAFNKAVLDVEYRFER